MNRIEFTLPLTPALSRGERGKFCDLTRSPDVQRLNPVELITTVAA